MYLFPDEGHHANPGENVLPRQPLAWDPVGKGLGSVGPWLAQVSHEERHVGPEDQKHFTQHVAELSST